KGKIAGNVRDGIRVKMSEEDAKQLEKRSIQYDTGFTLAPGKYRLKFLARENKSGKMGTFETEFVIPDLSAASPTLQLSSVVWSGQREALTAAVGSASNKKKLVAVHPLVQNNQKLIPSITRVFRKDQNLYVYFEVYDPATEGESRSPSVAAALTLFRGKSKVSESRPVRMTQMPKTRLNTVPFQMQAPLSALKPGRYTAQLNIIDELGRKFAFARAPLVVTP
ncbi:MAG: VWA domain-containing protein, partial [Bryobacteraceae bacterium]